MLDIHNMSEDDKLFNFMSGLQTWAQVELRRQGVHDIPSAMAAAESLADFRNTPPTPQGDKRSGASDVSYFQFRVQNRQKVEEISLG